MIAEACACGLFDNIPGPTLCLFRLLHLRHRTFHRMMRCHLSALDRTPEAQDLLSVTGLPSAELVLCCSFYVTPLLGEQGVSTVTNSLTWLELVLWSNLGVFNIFLTSLYISVLKAVESWRLLRRCFLNIEAHKFSEKDDQGEINIHT